MRDGVHGARHVNQVFVRRNLLRRKKYVTIKHMNTITRVLNVFFVCKPY